MKHQAKIKEIRKKRGSLIAKLTLFSNYMSLVRNCTTLTEQQITELECRLNKIENLYGAYDELQSELETLSEDMEGVFAEREEFETQYYGMVSEARTLLSGAAGRRRSSLPPRPGSALSEHSGPLTDAHDFVRLPKINLPSFDGNFQHWLEYRDTYISLIHNNKSISDINKFHYLRASLKGSASLIIQSLDFSATNYKIAWQLLSERYDNERLLVNNHINALFNLESFQKESSRSLRQLVDVTNKNLRALATLGQPTDHWDTLIIYIMSKKLDNGTYRQWEEHRNSLSGLPSLENFPKFINNRADLLDTIQDNKQTTQNKQNTLYTETNRTKNFSLTTKTTEQNKTVTCPMCNQNHFLFSCQPFRDLDVDTRLQKISGFQVCKNCLRPGHAEKYCKLSHCKYCNKKHNTLLHKEPFSEPNIQNTVVLSTDTNQTSNRPHVLLSTALVKVSDAQGKLHTARVLLDNGSTSHFITQRLCEKLGLVRRSAGSTVTGINNQISYSAESCDLTFESFSGAYKVNINCYILPEITKTLPSNPIDIQNIPLPAGIELADPSFNVPSAIDILVGAEIFWDVVCSNFIDLGRQRPKLQQTKLGWLVSGVVHNPTTHNHNPICYFTQNEASILTRFWELDTVSSKYSMSKEEQACEQSFVEHTRRDEDGRFVVTIPLKSSPEALGDSYGLAKRRFLSVERRLDREPLLKDRYLKFMEEYVELGHMSENTQKAQDDATNYYLPHHGVIREDSTTTKLRVVFDASAVTSSGESFNSIQMVGPVVQDDLVSILLRFRQHKYVVSSDVEKMYRAILVEPSQRHLQQIIFRFDKTEPLKTYTLNTVTYGTASAPYLATKCLVSLADQCAHTPAKNAIGRDFYVDDFISGGESIDSVVDLCKNVIDTLASAKFNLRKWQSNNSEILNSVSEQLDQNIKEKTLNLNDAFPSKTLGLHWDSNSDQLLFSIQLDTNKKKITKRVILSLISQVFDPLGLLGPCIVEAKIIMQKLWTDNCNWDDEVPFNTKMEFLNFIQSLQSLNDLRIPRWVCGDVQSTYEIHIFTDASERAYGACVYVRTVTSNGKVIVCLLTSKNKVAPIKPTTIPRLELCGALLGARLCTKVLKSLTLNIGRCFFWTDSMIVLGWLATSPSRLKSFVRNRVGEIQDSTAGDRWSYVPSKENPADLVSRGVRADGISDSTLWWSGPNFLHTIPIQFPRVPNSCTEPLPEISVNTESQNREIQITLHTQDKTDNENNIQKLIQKTSSYTKLTRVVAYIKRFIYNCRNKTKLTNNLTITELQQSEQFILRTAQQEMFPHEYAALKSGQSLDNKNRLMPLSPFIDSNSIIRVGGRLDNSNYSYDVKHPVLLCCKHHLTHIIFAKYHKGLLHSGPQLLLATIRQTYWPLGGRNLARRTVHKCVRCVRFKSKPVQPIMGNLPDDRTHLEFPFLHTGIDYAGPVLIVDRKGRGGKLTKSYICIFVCFAVKALHLELVTDLTKEAFLAAFYRFIARRGKPQTVYADNSTTFHGACNEITKLFGDCSDDIQTDVSNQGIEFKFIPPYTPHFGGLWESAVKSVKHHLRRILSLSHLTYEEMSTCLIQIESILNSRPLTPLSSDPSDLTCLTPSHFLIGRSLLSVPHPPLHEENIQRLQRYSRIEKLKQHFWQRFSQEYISLLQQKTKWSSSGDDLKLGALVLVRDKNQPPLLWLLGRVVRLYTGPDRVSRVADIHTKKGIIQRAYNNICPLPISC